MKKPALIVSMLVFVSGSALAVSNAAIPPTPGEPETTAQPEPQDVPIEEVELESTDEIVTEAEAVLSRTNYKAPPETTTAEQLVTPGQLQYASEIDLNRALSAVKEGLDNCIEMREAIEQRVGPRTGVWTVHQEWPKAYNNCVLQRQEEIGVIGDALDARKAQIVADGADEGATTMTALIDRLMARQSKLKLDIRAEMAMVPKLFDLYNTGTKNY